MLNWDHAHQKEDLDIAMPIYNLLKYSENHCITSENLGSYYRDEVNDDANENNDSNYVASNNKTRAIKFLDYKTQIVVTTSNNSSIVIY